MRAKRPQMDRRFRKPWGVKRRPVAVIGHTTEGDQIPGPRDRHGVIDYLAYQRGLSVPFVVDDDGITAMVPDGYLGYGHARGLTGRCTGVEQVGRAGWSRRYWLSHHRRTIEHMGMVCAYVLSAHMGLEVSEENLAAYVIPHAEDHRVGGTSDHWDWGPGYPVDVMHEYALEWAGKGDEFVALFEDRDDFMKAVLCGIVGVDEDGRPRMERRNVRRALEFTIGQQDRFKRRARPDSGARRDGWDYAEKLLSPGRD